MTYYNADITDLFLFGLVNFFWYQNCYIPLSQHIDPVVPIPTHDTSSDDTVEIANILQETEDDDEVHAARVSIA